MNVKQIIALCTVYTSCAVVGLNEFFTPRIATYGLYAHVALLTGCIIMPFAVLGVMLISNHFTAEFRLETIKEQRTAEAQRVQAIADNKILLRGLSSQLTKQLPSDSTGKIECAARVVAVENGQFALSIIYTYKDCQIGYDDVVNPSDDITVDQLSELINKRYNTLYEHSGLRIGLDRYHHYKKNKIL